VYIPALMGKRGFLRREASPKEVLEHCLRLAREVAPPTPKGKRGRPWRYDHGLYLGLLLFRAFFHLTYRKTEALLQDLTVVSRSMCKRLCTGGIPLLKHLL
jgi:hypothetical protein